MSNRLSVTIVTGNAAFENMEGYECARILRELADRLMQSDDLSTVEEHRLYDLNGNKVGTVKVEPC